jgi:hypothetical protein
LSHFEDKCDVISDGMLRSEESCDATSKNKLYGDAGALYCLSSGVADVAFINVYNLPTILGKQQNITN